VRRIAIVVSCVALTAAASAGAQVKKRTTYEDMQLFSQVFNQLRVNHPDSLDTHELIIAAIRGMLSEADPHSYVVSATSLVPEKEEAFRNGKLYPVPIEFAMLQGAPVVVSVAAGSSAAREDILPGDELVAIDSAAVDVQSTSELAAVLAGPKRSRTRLRLERRRSDGTYATFERMITREKVAEASGVPAAFMLDGRTGYVRVTTFENEKVADDLHAALGRLEKSGLERLVLDLRDNGGGLVTQASKIAGEFLPKGDVVYTASGRKADILDTGRVSRSFFSSQRRYPIVVLINRGTASAAELVAGALQDHDRALIVGQRSFGKSLLMRPFPLTEGSTVIMVIGQLQTPCGRAVQRQYRGRYRQSYYRLAGADRDTASRPSCKSSGGRTLYGGGGIEPDLVLDAAGPSPAWASRIGEEALFLKWTGGHVSASPAAYPSLATLAAHPAAAPGAVKDFRTFASKQGVEIPEGSGIDAWLEHVIAERVALLKWGDEGYYRMAAVLDDDVQEAVRAFDKAGALLALHQ